MANCARRGSGGAVKVKVAAKAGFCFGVRRAIEMAERTLEESGGKAVYSLGPLIHNPQVVRCLEEKGVIEVPDLDAVQEGTLIIRSHGVSPGVLERAAQKGLKVVDATCPYVRRAQTLARELAAAGYQVVVVGDREHPEVQGIVGWAGKGALVVEDPKEVPGLELARRVGVVAQTTLPQEKFSAVIDALGAGGAELKVCNTICSATAERQEAARLLARQVGVMVVVGGKNSANTRKLAALCAESGTPTYHIETAEELDPAWFLGVEAAGVTAGASTPDWIIEEVKSRMSEIMEGMGFQEEGMKEAVEVKAVRYGQILKGTVVHVGPDEVMVDVGAKSEGVIPLRELSCYEVTSPQDVVKVGDEIEVFVLKAEDNEGRLILSKEKADAERAWAKLEEAFQTGEPVRGKVREVVKGGLLVDVGVRAFLPASLVERGYVEDLSKYTGQEISARVVELNRSRKKVILSRKVVLEEEQNRLRQQLLESLQEGQVVKGVVRRLTQFGAFVDIGGIDGLLHISEMAWHRINHPSEVVKVGDEIEVMVLKVDRESEKISLGLKQVIPNPWETVTEKYPVGSTVKAKVVRLAPFGAFVQLEPGVEGLVHISHLANRHVESPDEVISEGEEVEVKVLSVDPAEKRIRLSMRDFTRERQEKERRGDNGPARGQAPPDVVTIGDMVGNLFEKEKGEE